MEIVLQKTLVTTGVYTVRAGSILVQNLARYNLLLFDKNRSSNHAKLMELVKYQPQTVFLKLLLVGEDHPPDNPFGVRVGVGVHVNGAWVFAVMDRNHSNFMLLFQMVHAILRLLSKPTMRRS